MLGETDWPGRCHCQQMKQKALERVNLSLWLVEGSCDLPCVCCHSKLPAGVEASQVCVPLTPKSSCWGELDCWLHFWCFDFQYYVCYCQWVVEFPGKRQNTRIVIEHLKLANLWKTEYFTVSSVELGGVSFLKIFASTMDRQESLTIFANTMDRQSHASIMVRQSLTMFATTMDR